MISNKGFSCCNLLFSSSIGIADILEDANTFFSFFSDKVYFSGNAFFSISVEICLFIFTSASPFSRLTDTSDTWSILLKYFSTEALQLLQVIPAILYVCFIIAVLNN